MTAQKKILDLTGSQYLVQKVKSAINDVDSSLSTHIADTDKHVTTADKNKWNNGVTQSYVFRYSSTALVASSTNANSLLDNTDNLKVGDKVIDSNGVLFSVTAIDTANSTFTIGTALIDLAQDSDVVHTSGAETISGTKAFSATPYIYNSDSTENSPNILFRNSKYSVGDTTDIGEQRIIYADKNGAWTGSISSSKNIAGTQYLTFTIYSTDNNNANISSTINYYLAKNGDRYFTPYEDNLISLGSTTRRWKAICATNYYYGSNNVEFSTKFVTTDTAQTISETKTFTNTIKIKKEIELTGSRLAYILPNFSASYSGLSLCTYDTSGAVRIGIWKVDDNDNTKHVLNDSLGYLNISTGSVNSVNIVYLTPRNASKAKLGDSVNKWHVINGVEPSSLSLPSGNASDFIDISSYFSNTGDGGTNTYTAIANGWIYLRLGDISSSCQATVFDANNNIMWGQSTSGRVEQMTIPILKGQTLTTQWTTTSSVTVANARFIPCQGNV